ncbi:MAG: AlkA N-terminal domain-containing protein [Myxococcales bacterium]
MLDDPQICYQALRARDERFDGRMFVGVTSTGVYCRPVCPARPARLENCRFFGSAAAAQEAGFRPCLRCRPETAPDAGAWRLTSNTVSRGLALIGDGELDGPEASVDILAARLGLGGRQLRRLFRQHLGASPLAVAQTRRVLFAKQLIHDTALPMAEIALAAGFGSIRRFNESFQKLYSRPPSALRRRHVVALGAGTVASTGVTVRLRYRPPYDWAAMLTHLRGRAVEGVERVEEATYCRTIVHEGECGTVRVVPLPDLHSVAATVRFPNVGALPAIIARLRRLFDLGADVVGIGAHLSRDPLLAPLIAARPGLRAPGGWDGFEVGVRAILGQQVSVEAARVLAGKLVRLCGRVLPAEAREASEDPAVSSERALSVAFPGAAQVARADLTSLPMPGARRRALLALAEASLADPRLFQPLATVEETVARLRAIPGVGDWTAHYIALRAVREPDAFPAGDVGLLRGASGKGKGKSKSKSNGTRTKGHRWTPAQLQSRAEGWRPWRAYAAQHLWTADAAISS